jgi:hypothetical protein
MKLGTYKHYKGNRYNVLFVAAHSETLEPLVIYQSTEEPEKVWARPLEMFEEMVTVDGVQVPRFEFIT